MKKILIAMALACLIPIISLSLNGNKAQAKDVPVWVDVRTEAEWVKGHLKNAILIPHDQIVKKISQLIKNKNQPIKLYSYSGRRAEIALHTLEKLGYSNVQNLGGYDTLKKKGN